MKIGIISDTHDKTSGISGAMTIFRQQAVGMIIHCGDWTRPATASQFRQLSTDAGIPVKGVLGNNDRETESFLALNIPDFELAEGYMELTVDDRRIAVHHGHHKPTLRMLLSGDHDLLLLGHSHKPRYDIVDARVIVNPGSTAFSIPRSKDWQASVAVYDTVEHQVEFTYFRLS
jgi:uncharacterized protein